MTAPLLLPLPLLVACSGEPATPPAPLEPLPDQKVLFVGVDGATWTVLGPMIEAGELPTFARLAKEGARMERFETLETTSSPLVWTSAATGRTPKHHGIEDYVETLPDGTKVPITSGARKVNAVWNVATDHGASVGVIGWWASWPAEEVDGYVVSDHANPATAGWMEEGDRYWTADPEALSALGHDIFPADLAPLAAEHWLDPKAFPVDDFQARGEFSEAQVAEAVAAPFNERSPYSWLKTFYAVDRPYFELAKRLHTERPVDLQMVYLRGPDPLQHYAWDLVEPEAFAKKPAHLERDLGIVHGVYRYVDTWLGELMDTLGPETTLIVASDHGAEPAARADNPKRKTRPGRHTRAAKGVLFVHGPHVKAGHHLDEGSPIDLAPTMAWALGLPLGEDLEGAALTDAFTDDFVARRGRTTIDSWGTREVSPGLPSPSDDVMIESLRGLGYVE